MTKEEEIRANVSVEVVQRGWEAMANQAIEARCREEALKMEIEHLRNEIDELKKAHANS